jgi:hypothetical protein
MAAHRPGQLTFGRAGRKPAPKQCDGVRPYSSCRPAARCSSSPTGDGTRPTTPSRSSRRPTRPVSESRPLPLEKLRDRRGSDPGRRPSAMPRRPISQRRWPTRSGQGTRRTGACSRAPQRRRVQARPGRKQLSGRGYGGRRGLSKDVAQPIAERERRKGDLAVVRQRAEEGEHAEACSATGRPGVKAGCADRQPESKTRAASWPGPRHRAETAQLSEARWRHERVEVQVERARATRSRGSTWSRRTAAGPGRP